MDNNNLIAYSKVHEHLLGRLPSSATYDDRIIAQKIGFLAQDTGIYLGDMNYFWHIRGPYSRSLASALRYFEKNRDTYIEECSRVKIYNQVIPKLNYLKSLIDAREIACPELIWLEICASLKYLSKLENSTNIEYLTSLLIKKKNFLKNYEQEMYRSWSLMNILIPN
ncbi:MAG: hypothetical protein ACQEXV_21590 [Bacillota bacterium]